MQGSKQSDINKRGTGWSKLPRGDLHLCTPQAAFALVGVVPCVQLPSHSTQPLSPCMDGPGATAATAHLLYSLVFILRQCRSSQRPSIQEGRWASWVSCSLNPFRPFGRLLTVLSRSPGSFSPRYPHSTQGGAPEFPPSRPPILSITTRSGPSRPQPAKEWHTVALRWSRAAATID